MRLLSPAISRFARMRYWTLAEWKTNPFETQREVLQDLVTNGQFSLFGKKFGLSETFSVKEFKKRVPVHTYDDLKPYIEKLMLKEDFQLWNTSVRWFAKSSGTTNDKSKFIPITEESLRNCHYQASKDVLTYYYLTHPDSDLLTGKGLVVGGSHQLSLLNDDIQFGDLSAVLLQNAPIWSGLIRTPELSIALLDEWEMKLEQLALATINEDVTSISGVPTWTMLLIKRVLQVTGKNCLMDVWPNFELYIHGGVSFLPYREQFCRLVGKQINFLEIYNASEGFFAAQDDANEEGMLLMLKHGIFYEFMPMEEYGKEQPRTIGLRAVELGKNYALVISTNGGLWRYLVGDTVLFTSLLPFRIKVTGRLKHYINTFGEEVMVDNTDKAIAMVCGKLGVSVRDYTVAPVYYSSNESGAHEWLIEFEEGNVNTSVFAIEIDLALKSLNSDYEAKRHKDIVLRLPIVRALPFNAFNQWLCDNGKMGGQHKVPRLGNDRKVLESVLRSVGFTDG